MIDLANNTTVFLAAVISSYHPRKVFSVVFMIVPTTGKTAPDPGATKGYGEIYTLVFDSATSPAKCSAMIGKSTAEVRTAILAEWTKYKQNPSTAEEQLIPLFQRVAEAGLA